MGLRQLSALLAMCIFGVVPATNAAVIERDMVVHIDETLITPGNDNAGNAGENLRFDIKVSPFVIQAGDTIVTHVTFDNLLVVTDTGNGFFGFGGNNPANLETMIFVYQYEAPPSNGSGVFSYTMDLDVVAGEPTMTSGTGGVNAGGGGMAVAYFFRSWTDTSIALGGLDITTQVISYNVSTGTGQFDTLSGIMAAGDFSVRAVPEPATLVLLGISLVGLSLSRRKQ